MTEKTQLPDTVPTVVHDSYQRIQDFAELLAAKIVEVDASNRNPTGITLRQAFDDYLSVRPLSPKTTTMYCQCFRLLEDWAEIPIHKIRQNMVLERHHELSNLRNIEGCGATRANQAMRFLRALVHFASKYYENPTGKPIVERNPVQILSAMRRWNREKRKRRFIQPHEFPRWFEAVQAMSNEAARDLILFLVFTGLRKGEGIGLRWEDVDFQAATFTVRDTKNGDDHTLPMSSFVFDLLWQRQALRRGQHVFHRKGSLAPVSEYNNSHRMAACQSGIPFSYHDLRRTFLTVADSLDIPKHIIKKLANHRMSDVTDGYLIQTAERLREPMEKITQRILSYVNAPPKPRAANQTAAVTQGLESLKGDVENQILKLVAAMANPSVTVWQIHYALWPDESNRRVKGSTGATMYRLEKRGYLVMVKRDRDCTKHYELSEAAKELVSREMQRTPVGKSV